MNRLTLSVITLALAIPAASLAATSGDNDVKISTAEYNLVKSSGQEMLYSDLKNAAEEVCGATDIRNAGSLLQAMNNRECLEEKLLLAVDDVDSVNLHRLHEQDESPVSSGR